MDRWFNHVEIIISGSLLLYAAVSVAIAYTQTIPLLFSVLLGQGAFETVINIGVHSFKEILTLYTQHYYLT